MELIFFASTNVRDAKTATTAFVRIAKRLAIDYD
ncbi:hypothetical protein Poly59_56900 [Rubripirellula reticaptiva]|uniref:Uncharacterized protein n=1 Tax=Rubripirellula reticaptiva TaxID=2528013 RepID=A0A5C6EFB4_9BACT|nr:hypothetical protein Poly59_56900 [Rubripirellula reticaptiva]